MTIDFDATKLVEEITMQAKETQEEFIFETIHPYRENVLQIKINKEGLKQILLNSVQKPQPKMGKWEYVQYDYNPDLGNWHCSECRGICTEMHSIEDAYNYCPNCGAKMEVEE